MEVRALIKRRDANQSCALGHSSKLVNRRHPHESDRSGQELLDRDGGTLAARSHESQWFGGQRRVLRKLGSSATGGQSAGNLQDIAARDHARSPLHAYLI